MSVDLFDGAVFDSAGCMYVLGCYGASARINDNEYVSSIDSILIENDYPAQASYGTVLAKIDTLGNIIWKKTICGPKNVSYSYPISRLVLHDNKLTFAINITAGVSIGRYKDWFYFWDTLWVNPSTGPSIFPFGKRVMTYIVTVNLDGTLHSAHSLDLKLNSSEKAYSQGLSECQLHIDDDNNIHLFTSSGGSTRSADYRNPPILVIDQDTNRTYTTDFLYCTANTGLTMNYAAYYKIDTNWNLVAHRRLVDNVGGRCMTNKLYLQSLSADKDGNMYVAGYYNSYNPDTLMSETKPDYVHLDSIHHLKITSLSVSQWALPFLIKYDNNGNVVWLSQLYATFDRPSDFDAFYPYPQDRVVSACVDSNNYGYFAATISPRKAFRLPDVRYFKDSLYQNEIISDHLACVTVVVKFNKTTGEFLDHCLPEQDTTYDFYNTATIKNAGDYVVLSKVIAKLRISQCPPTDTCRGAFIYKINKDTWNVTKTFLVTDNQYYDSRHIAINHDGHFLRLDSGCLTRISDGGIHVGNNARSAVMLYYYDSTLDLRPKPCPRLTSPHIVSMEDSTATVGWSGAALHQQYELAYIPAGGDWDAATVIQTADTAVTVTLPSPECHFFRVRGLCPTTSHRQYGSWSDSVAACPQVGIAPAATTSQYSLSPNPASGLVKLNGPLQNVASIKIVDMKGLPIATIDKTDHIDITDLPSGSYFVKIETHDKKQQFLKLVVL